MKKLTFITAIIAISMFATVVKAQKLTNAKTKEIATQMADKLNVDVVLTKKQKQEVVQKANDYLEKLQAAREIQDKKQCYALEKQAHELYHTALDSILTGDQKTKHIEKVNERKESTTSKTSK